MKIKLFNTLTKRKEIFRPLKDKKVGLYTCGPTVYAYAHLGNLRAYLFEDILKRVLSKAGYQIKHVMNITDVGHLTSDADTGEDKIEKASQKERKSAWEIAEFYTKAFKEDIKKLNILEPNIWCRATDYIQEQIKLIKILEKKGFTYKTSDGIYFDTSKLKTYGRLLKIKEFRSRLEKNPEKKSPQDFALWKFSPSDKKREMEWPSPWGIGFPGWHTECVVMAQKNLGKVFDIHCGGVDHIPIHHNNEIAQAEAAFGKIPARYWLHNEFLVFGEGKMSKSTGQILTLKDINEKGFSPLDYRYFLLLAHYRQKVNFSFKALKSAQNALNKIYQFLERITQEPKRKTEKKIKIKLEIFRKKFFEVVADDLNTPKALAILWELIRFYHQNHQKINPSEIQKIFQEFDEILGLDFSKIIKKKIPQEILLLVQERERARKEKNWLEADQLREKIKKLGYAIEDTPTGPKLIKI